jgi:hypothetical protein
MSQLKTYKLEPTGIYYVFGIPYVLPRCQEFTEKGIQCKDKACSGKPYCGKYYSKTFSDSETSSESRSSEHDLSCDNNGNLDGFVEYGNELSETDSYDEENDEIFKKSSEKLFKSANSFLKRKSENIDQCSKKKTRSGKIF